VVTSSSPALWQASQTSKKLTSISHLHFHEWSSKLLVASTFYRDHRAWRPGPDLQYCLSCHGFQGIKALNTAKLMIETQVLSDISSGIRQHIQSSSDTVGIVCLCVLNDWALMLVL
jgi:hypothetical protein